jgi:hypothetical protein
MDCPSQPKNPTTLCGMIDRMLDKLEPEARQQGLGEGTSQNA